MNEKKIPPVSEIGKMNYGIKIGIENYSTKTTPQKNVMTVDFAIYGKTMEPQDYQLIFDRLQIFCEEFTTASQRPNE